jgi:hypothetical protein
MPRLRSLILIFGISRRNGTGPPVSPLGPVDARQPGVRILSSLFMTPDLLEVFFSARRNSLVCRPTSSRNSSVIPTGAKRSGGTLCFQRLSFLIRPFQYAAHFRDANTRNSRARAVLQPSLFVRFKTLAQLVPRYAFAPVELGQTALDFSVDGLFIFLQPGLAFALYFPGVEQHVFHALEPSAMQPLLNQRFDFWAFYFDGHG